MRSLKEQIKNTVKGGVLELRHGGEFIEQLVIKKPITICSTLLPATIVGRSPTIAIQSKKVKFENLIIVSNDKTGICLSIKKRCNPVFKNVPIKGRVVGLKEEEGNWEIPDVLELGSIEPNKVTKKKIIIYCPAPAKIYSKISGIICKPENLKPDLNEIDIITDALFKNTFITGYLIIETLKFNLQRKISVTGNTLNLERTPIQDNDEYLWICESAKVSIDIPEYLPEGSQSRPYKFILDKEKANCKGYVITIIKTPDGLSFNDSKLFFTIKGSPKNHGEFDLKFICKKKNREYNRSSKLIIREKIPLKIAPLKNLIRTKENETVNIKIHVLSSNSSNVNFKLHKDLPGDLQLNESTGEISGKISDHGKYDAVIRIDDGTSDLQQSIIFYVLPKESLKLEIEKKYKFYKDHEFNIPITIHDSIKLTPKINLSNSYSGLLSLESSNGTFFIKGKLNKIKTYNVEIQIEDIYNRQVNETISIQCVKKPVYKIKWISDASINQKGRRSSIFSEKLEAVINEDKNMRVNFSCIGKLPLGYNLTEDGWLSGKIDGKSHSLLIRAEYDDECYSDKIFEITTHAESGIVHPNKNNIISSVFKNYSKDKTESNKYVHIQIKNELKNGRAYENYKGRLFTQQVHIPENISLTVNKLPPGLTYNPNNFSIEGMPERDGIYNIEVSRSDESAIIQVKLVIKKSPYYQTDNKSEESNENNNKSNPKIKLGGAFKNKWE